jgi:hypothetical protein
MPAKAGYNIEYPLIVGGNNNVCGKFRRHCGIPAMLNQWFGYVVSAGN